MKYIVVGPGNEWDERECVFLDVKKLSLELVSSFNVEDCKRFLSSSSFCCSSYISLQSSGVRTIKRTNSSSSSNVASYIAHAVADSMPSCPREKKSRPRMKEEAIAERRPSKNILKLYLHSVLERKKRELRV